MAEVKLNKEQYIAAHHFKGPMLVLAGPGSGKTKVLTERIRILIEERKVRPQEILVITFSKKAAEEMRGRFYRLCPDKNYPVSFGTFHSIFFSIIRQHKNYTKDNIISDRQRREYLYDAAIKLGIAKASSTSWQNHMLENISNYKNFGENYFENNPSCIMEEDEKEQFEQVYSAYNSRCRIEEKIDFDDMLLICRDLLYKHESVLRMWKSYFRFILIDEFQDINELQYDVLRLLAGDEKNVFCVGDDDQSIYAFRGARPEIMKKFLKQFPYCRQVTLLTNYRCCSAIVEAADNLIRNNSDRIDRPTQLVSSGKVNGSVELIESESSKLQADQVIEIIDRLRDEAGYKLSDFAILYRSAHCAKMFEMVCKEKQIPLEIRQKPFNIFELEIVKIILAYLKVSINQASRADFFTIMNNPPRGISREAISNQVMDLYKEGLYKEGLLFDNCLLAKNRYIRMLNNYYVNRNDKKEIIDELSYNLDFISKQPPLAAIIYILMATGLLDYLKNSKKTDNKDMSLEETIEMLKDSARAFDTNEAYLKFIDITCNEGESKAEKSSEASNDNSTMHKRRGDKEKGITLMTAHASKGLEFKVVFIIGLQEGLFPHSKSLMGKELEEERRLMYVAMTRARERLFLCGLGMNHGKRQSRFIKEALNNKGT